MKTILFVSNFGDIVGGGEISFYQLVKHLNLSKFRRFVVCPDKGELYTQIEDLGISPDIVRMPRLKGIGLLSLPVSVWRFMFLVKRLNIHLLHANGSRCMIYAGLAGRFARVPVVWHIRIMDKDRLLDRFLAMLSSKIIVNSKAVSRRFSFIPSSSKKVSVVYNGVDLKEFDACLTGGRIKEEYKINKAEKVVTIVGRLEEWKGHHVFLEAARQVLDRSNDVRFLVVGDGVMRNPLEALSKKLGIMSYVIFCGHRNDIPQILAASDLLVLASFGEHFGRVIIEAMAMEKPVVATKAGGVPELVIDGETGILVKPADSEGLASAILRLLEDPRRSKEMGNSGLKRVMEYFGIDRHVRDIEKIYEPLLH